MTLLLELLLLILPSFLVRLLFVLSFENDSFVYSWLLKKESMNKLGDHSAPNSLLGGAVSAPALFHRIVVRVFRKHSFLFLRIFVIIFDLVLVSCVYFFINYLFSHVLKISFGAMLSIGFYGALIVSLTPLFFPYQARLKSIGARTLGTLLGTMYFIGLGFFLINHDYLLLIALLPLVIIITMSSQFAMQAIVLIPVIYGIITLEFSPIIITISGIALGWFLPFTGIRSYFMNSKINHWVWYFKNYQNNVESNERNRARDWIRMPRLILEKKIEVIGDIVLHRTSFSIVIFMFPMWLLLFFMNDQSLIHGNDTWMYFLKHLFISSFIVFLLTSFRKLIFLGEAERYLEFAVIPGIVMFIYLLNTTYNLSILEVSAVILLYQISLIVISFLFEHIKSLKGKMVSNMTPEVLEVVEFLNEQSQEKLNVLSIPTKDGFLFGSESNKNIYYYYPFVGRGKIDGFSYMEEDDEVLYLPKDDLAKLALKYELNYLVIIKSMLKDYKSLALIPHEQVYQNQRYTVFEVKKH